MKQKFFFYAAGILLIMFSACKKEMPTASFTHTSESYEEGDTIYFTSTSSNADNFQWEFGDGNTSTNEHPWHIFNTKGSYEVKLKVTNDDGSNETSSTITIKDITILAFEVYKEGTEELLPGCAILVYDDQNEWENITENAVALGYTDNEGYVEFYHARAIVYYMYAFKEEVGGMWLFGGSTNTILLNQLNLYTVPVEWFPDEKKSTDYKKDLLSLVKKIQIK